MKVAALTLLSFLALVWSPSALTAEQGDLASIPLLSAGEFNVDKSAGVMPPSGIAANDNRYDDDKELVSTWDDDYIPMLSAMSAATSKPASVNMPERTGENRRKDCIDGDANFGKEGDVIASYLPGKEDLVEFGRLQTESSDESPRVDETVDESGRGDPGLSDRRNDEDSGLWAKEPEELLEAAPRRRGIDSGDTKLRRQSRVQGLRLRTMTGPEGMLRSEVASTSYETAWRSRDGSVMPLRDNWELAVLGDMNTYRLRGPDDPVTYDDVFDDEGNFYPEAMPVAFGKRHSGLLAMTLRLGGAIGREMRTWLSVTPYLYFGDGSGGSVGLSAGVDKNWYERIYFRAEAFAWQPWDEGYDTAVNDGRRHGFRASGSMDIDRRLKVMWEGNAEWLRLGPRAPTGAQRAGERYGGMARAEWVAVQKDDGYMGYGFRNGELWDEELVPSKFGFFGQFGGFKFVRDDDFVAFNPTDRSLETRLGVFLHYAVSTHLGVNTEAYIGQDTLREIGFGRLYGGSARLNVVVSPKLRFFGGWGYESASSSLIAEGGPTRTFSMGLHSNF